jgi:hypothetical protein
LAVNFGELISFLSMVEFYAERPLLGNAVLSARLSAAKSSSSWLSMSFMLFASAGERADAVKVLLVMTQPSSIAKRGWWVFERRSMRVP